MYKTWLSEPNNYLFIAQLKYNEAELGQGICVMSLFAVPFLVLDRVAFNHCSLGDRCEFLVSCGKRFHQLTTKW